MDTRRGFVRNRGMIGAAGRHQAGVMLLEVLIAILIFSVGILAVVGMQVAAINNVNDSKYRSEAAFLTNRLLSQMWTDAGNIAAYAYIGSGGVPAKLNSWINDPTVGVNKLLPNAANVPPIVTITGASANGAQVTIRLRWQNPEEQSKGLPVHNYVVVASVYTS